MANTDAENLPAKALLATRVLSLPDVVRTARQNLLEIIPELATRQNMVSGRMIKRWHMVMDPGGLKRILREHPQMYPKSHIVTNMLRPGIGESLFIAEGRHWLWQRRAATPVFSTRNIAGLAPTMTKAVSRMIARLKEDAGSPVDMHREIVATTFEVISDITFSGGESIDRSVVHKAIDDYIRSAAKVSLLDVIGAPGWVPRPGRIKGTQAIRSMRRIAESAIRARQDSSKSLGREDLLDLLRSGQDPKSGRKMNAIELRDNLLTFIVAGHETTALALSWSLYLLAFDPAVQETTRTETRKILGNRVATAADLERLVLTRRVVQEALRLYPPAALLAREAQHPDKIGGREVRRGDTMFLPIYALHRNRLLWNDPDGFDPDRFTDPRAINPYAFLPFGGGPRICIGMNFAMTEAVIMLSSLISRFRFTRAAGRNPAPVLILTLRPEEGIWLNVEPI